MGLQVQTRGKKDGADHRNVHPGLVREVRGLPQGAGGGIHPEKGSFGFHAGDDHLRGGRQLDDGHQDHCQEHRAQVQNRRGVRRGHDRRPALQDDCDVGRQRDDHQAERHQAWGQECGCGEGVQRRGVDLQGHLRGGHLHAEVQEGLVWHLVEKKKTAETLKKKKKKKKKKKRKNQKKKKKKKKKKK